MKNGRSDHRSNPVLGEGLIVVGLPAIGAGGAHLCWLSWKGGFGISLDDILLSVLGAFCLVVAVKGLPLLRFLNHSVTLHADGLVIAKGGESKHLNWDHTEMGSDTIIEFEYRVRPFFLAQARGVLRKVLLAR